ncbi:hypothetical protein GLAREA_06004 [Glarea lozoyensis ATCC 20868]|uniref:Secreted protein n=1 Tax=Glarea lozoyensis (strain ATCC 20868 / MF5171) TaxID=1116229 RepID=S3D3C8_GLAL2|nr:uncharacterized protein GLAREA_06004 [Glarea lozoyensis ATCC 20868]EPE32992.1 hypothetical protein GLAREA_06004 [Glarea lozoyensis ATCC 20868]
MRGNSAKLTHLVLVLPYLAQLFIPYLAIPNGQQVASVIPRYTLRSIVTSIERDCISRVCRDQRPRDETSPTHCAFTKKPPSHSSQIRPKPRVISLYQESITNKSHRLENTPPISASPHCPQLVIPRLPAPAQPQKK